MQKYSFIDTSRAYASADDTAWIQRMSFSKEICLHQRCSVRVFELHGALPVISCVRHWMRISRMLMVHWQGHCVMRVCVTAYQMDMVEWFTYTRVVMDSKCLHTERSQSMGTFTDEYNSNSGWCWLPRLQSRVFFLPGHRLFWVSSFPQSPRANVIILR
jgi:hypothetical protein